MANPQIDQFINALFFKAGTVIVLCGIGGMVLREGLHWLERRATRFGRQRQQRRIAGQTAPRYLGPTDLGESPHCPQCNELMVRRKARRGASAGSSFWGCPKYPDCRGTRDV